MAKPLYTAKQRQKVIARALEAVEARIAGRSMFTVQQQTFFLNKGGLCDRFIRQVFETALGLPATTWEFAAPSATSTLNHLRRRGYEVSMDDLQAGDIVGHTGGQYGHIVLYLGEPYGDGRRLVAENTSATRGFPEKPGTKITRLAVVLALGYRYRAYRLFPTD